MKRYILFILFAISSALTAYSQSTDQNYICTIVPRVETTDASSLSPSQALITVGYFDGLGHPVQTVAKGITPSSQDLVSIVEYDEAGRQTREWLPVAMNGTAGSYRTSEEVKAHSSSFYDGDEYAYVHTSYDYSPLNRVLKKLGPGADWHLNDQAQCFGYFTNTAIGELSVPYITIEGDKLRMNGTYPAGSFTVRSVEEEGGVTYYEFTDMEGKLIKYKNVQYIYDDLGRLRYVLPKQVFNYSTDTNIQEGLNETTSKTGIYKFGYAYTYDSRGNCIAKRLPGIAPIYYVYDSGSRLILSQTPNQRVREEWSFNKYDAMSRIILSGTTLIRNQSHQALLNGYSKTLSREELNASSGVNYGYTNLTLPKENLTILKTNYYDNYDFAPLVYFRFPIGFVSRSSYPSSYHTSPKGQLTCSISRTLSNPNSGPPTNLYTVFYYDRKGLLIQQRSNNLLDGQDNFYTRYNFSGEPVAVLHEHTSTYVPSLTEHYQYQYDSAGRMTSCTHSLNNGTSRTIASITYDDLGRVKSKSLPLNLDQIAYEYNTRSMLTGIQSVSYQQTLHYGHWPVDRKNYAYDGTPAGASYQYTYKDPVTNKVKQSEAINFIYDFKDDQTTGKANSVDLNGDVSKANLRYSEYIGSEGRGRYERGCKGKIVDQLYMSSEGYQLSKIYEDTGNDLDCLPIQYISKRLLNYSVQSYDPNGNYYRDPNRGIDTIAYNVLNLPDRITFENGSYIHYTYDADGIKRRATYKTVANEMLLPIGMPAQNASGALVVNNRTDYCGNLIYEDNVLKKIRFDGGYINYDPVTQLSEYCYYIQDQVRNNCVIISEERGVIQYANYYPFGIPFSEIPIEEDNFLHAGKELERMHGLYWYDNGQRWYDPALARFTTMDPLCEKYYDKNPYAYCGDNPLKYEDPTGKDYILTIDLVNMRIYISGTYYACTQDLDYAKAALDFWNNQSNKLNYSTNTGNFSIFFDLKVSEVYTDESMGIDQKTAVLDKAFRADKSGGANVFQVVSDTDNSLDSNVNGRTITGNYIKVKDSQKEQDTSSHEVGHTLGLLHSFSGLMTPSSTDVNRSRTLEAGGLKDVITNPLSKRNTNGGPEGKGLVRYFNPLNYDSYHNSLSRRGRIK